MTASHYAMDLSVYQSLRMRPNIAGICHTLFSEKKSTGDGGCPLRSRLLAPQRHIIMQGVTERRTLLRPALLVDRSIRVQNAINQSEALSQG